MLCDQILKGQLSLNLLNEFMKTLTLASPNYLQGAAENALMENVIREVQFLFLSASLSLPNRQTRRL